MTENFSSVDATEVCNPNMNGSTGVTRFDQTGLNRYAGAAFNLNGLGPDATLTLIDGHRMAPAGGSGSFADYSVNFVGGSGSHRGSDGRRFSNLRN